MDLINKNLESLKNDSQKVCQNLENISEKIQTKLENIQNSQTILNDQVGEKLIDLEQLTKERIDAENQISIIISKNKELKKELGQKEESVQDLLRRVKEYNSMTTND